MFDWYSRMLNAGRFVGNRIAPNNSNSNSSPTVVYKSDEEELAGFTTPVSLKRGDVLVVPEGKKGDVPEKYHSLTIELPNSIGYAVIK